MVKKFLVVVLVFYGTVITAQKTNLSPYSIFGIGEDSSPKTVEQASMGGIGVAMKKTGRLNFVNPAGYADIRYATYGLAGRTTFLALEDLNKTESGSLTTLRYLALAFPLSKKSGFSINLHPFSSVGYSLLKSNSQLSEDLTQLKGSGGANRLSASFGSYVFNGFSVGLEGGFVFGSFEKIIIAQKANVSLATKYQKESVVRGVDLKIGVQYKTEISNDLEVSTGISIKLSNELKVSGRERLYGVSYSSGQEVPNVSMFDREHRSNITTPLHVVSGLGIGKSDKWYVGVNSEYSAAKDNTYEDSATYKYGSGLRTSMGGFYIPKKNSISSYWDRVTYRVGVRHEKSGLFIKSNTSSETDFTPINDFGINLGIGLPLPRQLSNLNLGFEYGQKGTLNNNLIKENYINIRLGLSLNSKNWFNKREID